MKLMSDQTMIFNRGNPLLCVTFLSLSLGVWSSKKKGHQEQWGNFTQTGWLGIRFLFATSQKHSSFVPPKHHHISRQVKRMIVKWQQHMHCKGGSSNHGPLNQQLLALVLRGNLTISILSLCCDELFSCYCLSLEWLADTHQWKNASQLTTTFLTWPFLPFWQQAPHSYQHPCSGHFSSCGRSTDPYWSLLFPCLKKPAHWQHKKSRK